MFTEMAAPRQGDNEEHPHLSKETRPRRICSRRTWRDRALIENTFYRNLVQFVIDAKAPLFYEMTDASEYANFSAHYNFVLIRDHYANNALRGLYFLHDFTHMLFYYPHDLSSVTEASSRMRSWQRSMPLRTRLRSLPTTACPDSGSECSPKDASSSTCCAIGALLQNPRYGLFTA
jgi:hypothetical protein